MTAVAERHPTTKVRATAFLQGLWANRNGKVGLVIAGLFVLLSLLAAFGWTPYPPTEQHIEDQLVAPSSNYWLGTDQFGRDLASRIMGGALASLKISLLAVAISATAGTLGGIVAGFFGGWVDRVIGRVTDVFFAFPAILLALVIVAALGAGEVNTAVAVGIVYMPVFVRVARGPVLSLREVDFIRAGRVLGYSTRRLLFRHILPNVAAPVTVQITLSMSWAILTESSLSFLGLGIQPPEPSLGQMVSDARTLASVAWWTLAAPATFIALAVVGFNLLGDGLRDVMDPRRSGVPTHVTR